MSPTALFVANWKMNFTGKEALSFLARFASLPSDLKKTSEVAIAPSFTVIPQIAAKLQNLGIDISAQNIHWDVSGAHTGEISAVMLTELGVKFVIVGHSERRQFYGETDENVAKRLEAAIAANLTGIICVGETKEQFEASQTKEIVFSQLQSAIGSLNSENASHLVVAYEPVWAIGTGLAATPEIAASVHTHIRLQLLEHFGDSGQSIRILYGGSTTEKNVAAMMSQKDINGALVGGASLKPDIFHQLIVEGNKANLAKSQ
jgi:triosephosphate isomerase